MEYDKSMKYWFLGILTALIIFFSFLFLRSKSSPTVLSIYDENYSVFQRFIPLLSDEELVKEFEQLVKFAQQQNGTYGIYIKNLSTQDTFSYNETELFYGASLYKTPIAVAAMRAIQDNNVSMEDEIEYQNVDYFSGTGSINQSAFGTKFTLNTILDKLLKESDNSAQNMLIRTLGQEKISQAFKIIKIENYFYVNNTVTPEQMSNFFEQLVFSGYLTPSNIQILYNKMSSTLFDDRIYPGLDEGIKFAHKIGNWPETSTWHDCGIAIKGDERVIVCVMSRNTSYEQFLAVAKESGKFASLLFREF
jgi:beta-lactamase class A